MIQTNLNCKSSMLSTCYINVPPHFLCVSSGTNIECQLYINLFIVENNHLNGMFLCMLPDTISDEVVEVKRDRRVRAEHVIAFSNQSPSVLYAVKEITATQTSLTSSQTFAVSIMLQTCCKRIQGLKEQR